MKDEDKVVECFEEAMKRLMVCSRLRPSRSPDLSAARAPPSTARPCTVRLRGGC